MRSTSLAVCRAGSSHVPIDTDRSSIEEMRGSERSESDRGLDAGATRTDDDRCRRRGGGGGDGDGDGHHRCVAAALQCDIQPIIHDARFLSATQPPQTSRHARLSRRIAPRSRRRCLCSRSSRTVVVVPLESIYVIRCRSTTKKSATG